MALSSFEKKTILVIGGAGFIGSHLCEALVRRAQVICVDNFSTSTTANIHSLLQQPDFELIRHDINEPLDLEAQHELDRFRVRVHGIQEVYYLASPVNKTSSDAYRLATMQTNSTGLRHVLDLAARYQAKVLYASSADLYEPTTEPYVSEDARCWNDHLSLQAASQESRRFAETTVYTYGDVHHLPAKIVRLFTSYGPRLKSGTGFFLPDLIRAALAHEDVELPYSEDTRFSLCYIVDVVDALIKAMEHALDFHVLNIGSDQEVRLGSVVDQVLRLTNAGSRVRFRPQESLDLGPVPNIHKARQLLHWLPLIRSEEGLKLMVDYARSKHHEIEGFQT